jgi:adenylate cyclase
LTEPTSRPSDPSAAAIGWLLREGRAAADAGAVAEGLCRQLAGAGVPLMRHSLSLNPLHPQVRLVLVYWRRDGSPSVETIVRDHGIERGVAYLASPIHRLTERGEDELRYRLEGREGPWEHPVLGELKEQGATDYATMALVFDGGRRSAASFATDWPGGFTDEHLDTIQRVLPAYAAVLETLLLRQVARTVLDTYVGPRTAGRILDGGIRRGGGADLRAVLWYCDLRGFTPLADRLPRAGLISLLNGYFDIMGGSVEREGGEILKFIGDAMLAILPLEDGAGEADACRRALAAARAALAGIAARNRERAGWGEPTLRCGIALHIGDVMYGNIGSATRLDFTVIGPAVNLVNRIEGLCKVLDRPALASAAFAAACPETLAALGAHPVKGLTDPVAVFAVDP